MTIIIEYIDRIETGKTLYEWASYKLAPLLCIVQNVGQESNWLFVLGSTSGLNLTLNIIKYRFSYVLRKFL